MRFLVPREALLIFVALQVVAEYMKIVDMKARQDIDKEVYQWIEHCRLPRLRDQDLRRGRQSQRVILAHRRHSALTAGNCAILGKCDKLVQTEIRLHSDNVCYSHNLTVPCGLW